MSLELKSRAVLRHKVDALPWPGERFALTLLVFVFVLVMFFVARADLPYVHHADEPTNLRIIDAMVVNGDPNPHFFNYPSLFLYLQAAVHLEGPLLGWLGGSEQAPASQAMGMSMTTTPFSVLLHRLLTVLFAVLGVLAVHATTRRLTGRPAPALIAAVLLAASSTLAVNARLVTPDVIAMSLVAVVCWAAVRLWQTPSMSAFILAGLLVGLAASAKYNAGLVAVPVIAGALLACTTFRQLSGGILRLMAAGGAAGLAFIATTPFALLDFPAFWSALSYERWHYATAHPGMDGDDAGWWYVEYLFTTETLLAVGAAVAVGAALAGGRRRAVLLIGAFPLVYSIFVASLAVHNARTILIILPALAVLVGLGLGTALEQWRASRWLQPHLATVVVVILLTAQFVRVSSILGTGDSTWSEARRWIEQTVPPGSTVLAEAYSPWVDPERYEVATTMTLGRARGLFDAPPNVVIASEAMYARYLEDPDRFPLEAMSYRRLFDGKNDVRVFAGNGPTIRIFFFT